MNDDDRPREAAALKYQYDTDDAPYIVALGKGHVADKMVEAAQEHDVQIVKDANLSGVLQQLSVGDEIPESLYRAVAEVLIYVSNLDTKYGERFGLDKKR